MTDTRESLGVGRDTPVACGWCGSPVACSEGWPILHSYGLCRLLADVGEDTLDPPCLVTVRPDVFEWLGGTT